PRCAMGRGDRRGVPRVANVGARGPRRCTARAGQGARMKTPTAPAAETETRRLLRRWQEGRPRDRLAHLVKDTARAFDRALQARLADLDVSIGHWSFLRVLWKTDGLTQRELAREAGVMDSTAFIALRALAARGYVVRRPVAGDRRKKGVFL